MEGSRYTEMFKNTNILLKSESSTPQYNPIMKDSTGSTLSTNITTKCELLPPLEKILLPVLEQLNTKMSSVAEKYEKLAELNDSLIKFNQSFGSFLLSIQANNETIRWEYVKFL